MIIETENLTKVYQNKAAVNSVNLSVEKGQIYGFLGPNGAGKSKDDVSRIASLPVSKGVKLNGLTPAMKRWKAFS